MKVAFLLISLLMISPSAYSRQADTLVYYSAGFQAHYGFIISHAEEIEPVSNTNPMGFEINLNRLNTSYNSWKVFNTYWFSGIQATQSIHQGT